MPVALREFQPWSLLETALFTVALLLIYRNRYMLLCPLIALATLNRETALFIPLAFLFTRFDIRRPQSWKLLVSFAIYICIWFATFMGLRYSLGPAPHILTLAEIVVWNLQAPHPMEAIVHVGLFLGFFWIFALLGFRNAPAFCRRAVLVVPLYLVTVLVWGVWYEVRLLMPLYPIVIPLGLSFICRET
jgi:hypothetical protein